MIFKRTKNRSIANASAALAFVLASSAQVGHTQPSDSMSDEWLEGRLDTLLDLDPNLSGPNLDAEVTDRTAILTGIVDNEFKKNFAGDIAIGVDGIVALENNILVSLVEGSVNERFLENTQDSAITAAISTKFLLSTTIDSSKIDVETADNYVQLKGEVATERQRKLAEDLAQQTYGVERLQNFLLVAEP